MAKFLEVFEDATKKGTKIPTDEYLKNGKYPIIDQGQTYISGYYNDETGLFVDVPAIIFGDHTRIIKYVDQPCFLGADGVKLLKAKDKQANYKYLFYVLRNAKIPNTGYNRHFKWLKELEIPIPPTEVQHQIVSTLDKVTHTIDLCNAMLEKLDLLVKARFVEMFGDPRNNKQYEYVPFESIVDYMGDIGSNGANKVVVEHLDMKDEEDYALMVRFLNFTKNDFSEDVKYISEESYDFFKKSQLHGGELIICKIGSAGLNYVMPNLNRPVSLGLNQIMVRINDRILMPYLYQYLHTDYGEYLIAGCINGAVTKSITKTELRKIPVLLPPMDEQEAFQEFVTQVDKSKFVVQQALEKAQLLFDSLMQEYFG